ncbi:MAG TPA: citrate synthase [Acidimicrobiia bacterium]|nr:citrate synthase [Acidimicrobiia bacterium]
MPEAQLPRAETEKEPAELTWNGTTIKLPVVRGTEDERGIDIAKLRAQTGLITLDYGYMNTGATESAITFVDGEAGILRYRGYDIDALADQETPSFLETAWLLIYGELPSQEERDSFSQQIRMHTLLHEDVKRFYDGFPKDAHPMATLSAVVSAMSTFYQQSEDPHDPEQVQASIIRLLAKLPTVAAYSYKKSIGQPFLYPDNSLDLIENFMRMMFAVPSEPYEVSDTVVHALKQLLILHADHEQNCSTSTVRLVGSSDANIYASIAAGINALWGPLHGGANQAAVEMLEEIRDRGGSVQQAVARAKDPSDDFRLSGFGHRVYKNYDPRARILKVTAERVLAELGGRDELFDIALELEQVALTDEFFIEKKLYPNVDFYSGLIYRAIGFPTNMFPVLFAIGRLPGWIAHWKESNENAKTKIGRPRQIYTGPTERKYVEINDRK